MFAHTGKCWKSLRGLQHVCESGYSLNCATAQFRLVHRPPYMWSLAVAITLGVETPHEEISIIH